MCLRLDSPILRYYISRYNILRYYISKYNISRYDISRYNISRYYISKYNILRYYISRYNISRYYISRYYISRSDYQVFTIHFLVYILIIIIIIIRVACSARNVAPKHHDHDQQQRPSAPWWECWSEGTVWATCHEGGREVASRTETGACLSERL